MTDACVSMSCICRHLPDTAQTAVTVAVCMQQQMTETKDTRILSTDHTPTCLYIYSLRVCGGVFFPLNTLISSTYLRSLCKSVRVDHSLIQSFFIVPRRY